MNTDNKPTAPIQCVPRVRAFHPLSDFVDWRVWLDSSGRRFLTVERIGAPVHCPLREIDTITVQGDSLELCGKSRTDKLIINGEILTDATGLVWLSPSLTFPVGKAKTWILLDNVTVFYQEIGR